ncbi:uncharacterized protein KZ484_002659 isoform 1-T1 [Pholidichthys leucotaenia]
MDKLRLQVTSDSLNHSGMMVAETRLDQNNPGAATELAGRGVFRTDGTVHSDPPQHNDCNQEEALDEQQLLNPERHFIVVQVEPDSSHIKEEQEELCISQEGGQFRLKQEAEVFHEGMAQQFNSKGQPAARSLKICSWNCKGLNQPIKREEVCRARDQVKKEKDPPADTPRPSRHPIPERSNFPESCTLKRKDRDTAGLSLFEKRLLLALEGESCRTATPPPPPPASAPDPDELFFQSLLPSLRRLPESKKEEVKFQFHKLLFEAGKE